MFKTTHHPRAYLLIVIPALLLFFWLAVDTAVSKSTTPDEPTHLLRGYALWTTGELQYQGAHTPFSHWLMGGLLTLEPTLPDLTTLPDWDRDRVQLSRQMLFGNEGATNLDRTLLLGRYSLILLGLLLGAIIVQWVRSLFGTRAAWIAAILFATAPNWLATISLAITDGPLTVTYFAAVWGLWHYQKRPSSLPRFLLAGIILGLALSTKITALLLLPVSLLLLYSQWNRQESLFQPFLRWMRLLPLAFLVVWASYGFEFGPPVTMAISVPAPTYVNNFLKVQEHVDTSHATFLLGEHSQVGWWYYFIIAFLIKTPLSTQLLLFITTILVLRRRDFRRTVWLWLPAGSLFVTASITGLNIGFRHILPIQPFVWSLGAYVGASGVMVQKHKNVTENSVQPTRLSQLTSTAVLLLLIWAILGTLRQHPHHLAYFNETIGGPKNGHQYLSDSNIDWGQDIDLLFAYADEADQPMYYSIASVESGKLHEKLTRMVVDRKTGQINGFNPANPAAGRYAISVTSLNGTPFRDPDIFYWFRQQTPITELGYSIYVYDVAEQVNGAWIGHCLIPVPILEQPHAEDLVGQFNLRHFYFDCSNSWVFPENGAAGWYILPPNAGDFLTLPALLTPIQVYGHAANEKAPAYSVYYWPGEDNLAAKITGWPGMVTLASGEELKRPFSINHIANFLGYQQNNATWLTAWQVENTPTDPLSMMAHLQGAETTVQVADDLGFSSDRWLPGDVIVQQFVFEEGEETAVFLRTGLYNYLSSEQLPLANHPDATFQLAP